MRARLSAVIAFALLAQAAQAVEVSDKLLDAIAWVETRNGEDTRDGDGGRSVGPWQIQVAYLADANAWAGTSFSHEEMRDPAKARFVVRAYLDRWGTRYERQTGRVATAQVLARCHNGGPSGWRKKATVPYWRKVKARMEAHQ